MRFCRCGYRVSSIKYRSSKVSSISSNVCQKSRSDTYGILPKEVKDQYPNIAWKEAAGFRDILIHDYFGVDLETVWETVKSNIPKTKPLLYQVLGKLKTE